MRLADLLQPAPKNENWKRTPATVATVATVGAEVSRKSQVSQGVTFENHFSDPPTVPQTAAERVEAVLHRYGLPLDLIGPILAHGGAEVASRLHGLALARFVNFRATRALHDRGVLHGCWAIPSVAHLPPAEVTAHA